MLIFPLNDLPWAIRSIMNSRFSFSKIKQFLDYDEITNPKRDKDKNDVILSLKATNLTWMTNNNNQDKDESFCFRLKNIDLQIKANSLIMIIGSIGSGKTALVKALLNEMNLHITNTETNVYDLKINGSIAFVSQNVWLQHTTIKVGIMYSL